MEQHNPQEKRLYRSKTDRVILGVCGGLGEYFDIDPIIFRIAFIALTIGAGSGVLLYIVLALLTPQSPATNTDKGKLQPVDFKEKVDGLVSELKENSTHQKKSGGALRLFFGLLFLIIGFGLLAQNLNLIPRFMFDFSILVNLWPIIIILIGVSLLSNAKR